MGCIPPRDAPCAKGWLIYALEQVSRAPQARTVLAKLYDELKSGPPDLTETFDRHLLSPLMLDEDRIPYVRHLRRCWFGEDHSTLYFPGEPVAEVFAHGLTTTLELALRVNWRDPALINSWWMLDAPAVRLTNIADADRFGQVTAVTLLVQTPRPRGTPADEVFILGKHEVWSSDAGGTRVIKSAPPVEQMFDEGAFFSLVA